LFLTEELKESLTSIELTTLIFSNFNPLDNSVRSLGHISKAYPYVILHFELVRSPEIL